MQLGHFRRHCRCVGESLVPTVQWFTAGVHNSFTYIFFSARLSVSCHSCSVATTETSYRVVVGSSPGLHDDVHLLVSLQTLFLVTWFLVAICRGHSHIHGNILCRQQRSVVSRTSNYDTLMSDCPQRVVKELLPWVHLNTILPFTTSVLQVVAVWHLTTHHWIQLYVISHPVVSFTSNSAMSSQPSCTVTGADTLVVDVSTSQHYQVSRIC
jgi:hypothetical protein